MYCLTGSTMKRQNEKKTIIYARDYQPKFVTKTDSEEDFAVRKQKLILFVCLVFFIM